MTVEQDIVKIQNEAHLYGEGVHTRAHYSDGVVVIDLIAVPVTMRRKGIASQLLNEYIDVADGWGVPLMLEASTDFNTPRAALHSLYSQNGFMLKNSVEYFYYPVS